MVPLQDIFMGSPMGTPAVAGSLGAYRSGLSAQNSSVVRLPETLELEEMVR